MLGTLLLVSVAPALSRESSLGGGVTAKATGQPVAGATIAVEGTELVTTTDAAGRFRFDGELPSSVDLVVTAAGFVETTVSGVVPGAGEAVRIQLETSPTVSERVQVTASKLPLSLAELPGQVDVVEREEIELRGDQKLTEAVAHVPGLLVSTQAGSFESVIMRGLPRDGNEFTTTLLLVDGVPQTDSRNSARVVNLTLDGAGTIEVVHGPSSALYGRTAIGGAIQVLTADPTADHRAAIAATAGSFETRRAVARAGGPLSQRFGYFVSGSLEENEGFWSGPSDYEAERNALFGKLAWNPGPSTFGRLSLDRVRSDQSTPTNVPVIDGRLLSDIDPRFDPYTNLNLPGPNYHQEEDRLTATHTQQLGRSTALVGLFGYREIVYQFIDDGDVTGSPFDLEAATLTMYPFEQRTAEDISYSELRLEIVPPEAPRARSFLAGVSYENTSGFSAGNLIFTDEETFGIPLGYLDPNPPPRSEWQFFRFGGNDYSLESTGLFAQARLVATDDWSFVVAARHDSFDIDNRLTFQPGTPRIADSFDELSPKLSAVWDVPGSSDLHLYASYAEAFLPPRRPSDLRPSGTPPDLEPEDVENLELGLNGSAARGRLSLQAALFSTQRTGIITTVRQGPFFLPTNAGEHEYEGLEAGARFSPTSRVTVYGNAALYHNRFGDFVIESEDGDVVLTGNRLPIAPDAIWNVGATLTPIGPVDVAVDVKHVGEVAVDQRNTFELDPYTLVDAAVTWSHGPLALTLSASNLFDEEYFWNGDTSTAESADVGAKRQVLLTARFELGS